MKLQTLTLLLIIGYLIGCSPKPKDKVETDQQASPEVAKGVSDLQYGEVVALVLADTSNLGEWHNTPIESEANDDLSLDMKEPCGEANCGKAVYLVNSGGQTVSATVSTVYAVEENPWQISQVITIGAGQQVNLGCSHLCYGGESILFERKIEGSKYGD